MPELPEVETIVRELREELEGQEIDQLEIINPSSLDGAESEVRKTLLGRVVVRAYRRGKYICLLLDTGKMLSIHLRMTGKVLFAVPEKEKKYIRISLSFKSLKKMHFVDVRKFGRVKLWSSPEELSERLGPEPLAADEVEKALKGCFTARAVKTVLLDQKVLVGVGNIYADESLFFSGIHPTIPLKQLKPARIKKLSTVIPFVLDSAIKNMGTTLSDYRSTKNIGGENQNYLKVYGQDGDPCVECETIVLKITLGGRGTHYCPKCQKLSLGQKKEKR